MHDTAANILLAACAYNGADPKRNHHLLKVHNYCRMIAEGEQLDAHTRFVLEAAAALHDIGIHEAERVHGSTSGAYQQLEGPPIARQLLAPFALPAEDVERICWLIAHHHTYSPIDGIDHQILLEADFLVNAEEEHMKPETLASIRERVFKTESGTRFLDRLFGIKDR